MGGWEAKVTEAAEVVVGARVGAKAGVVVGAKAGVVVVVML